MESVLSVKMGIMRRMERAQSVNFHAELVGVKALSAPLVKVRVLKNTTYKEHNVLRIVEHHFMLKS